ncbi:hypothetical protein AFCA_004828 [Aspergillus flavus]|nr:hypothetical protein AFCA_004828 [Aspergillus flavus]
MSRPSRAPLRRRHVGDIIGLYPATEPWCAGYATSLRRRCHRRLLASDCAAACTLLDQATDEVHAGHSIDQHLEDLASLVLCTNDHQGQASDLIDTWSEKVNDFLTKVTAFLNRVILEQEPRAEFLEMLGGPAGVTRELHGRLSRLRVSEGFPSPVGPAIIATSAILQRRIERQSSTPAHNNFQTDSLAISVPSQYPDIATRPAQGKAGFTGSPRSSVTRRSVEGDCAMCLLPLWEPGLSTDDREQPKDISRGNDRDENYIENSSVSIRACLKRDKLLVWCKKECGTNFHKDCMNQWIETCLNCSRPAKCPMCQTPWNMLPASYN